MQSILEIIIFIMAIFGIIFTTASFFNDLILPNYLINSKYNKNSRKAKSYVEVYILEEDEKKYKELVKKIQNNKDLKYITDDINIYKLIDKK